MQHALATRAGELKRSDVAAAGYAKGVFADGAEADVLDNCVAIVHQIESMVAFILSARGVGYLPEHVAWPWIEGGHMKIVLPDAFNMRNSGVLGGTQKIA